MKDNITKLSERREKKDKDKLKEIELKYYKEQLKTFERKISLLNRYCKETQLIIYLLEKDSITEIQT